MKKLLFGLIAIVALTFSANAQQFRSLKDFTKLDFGGFGLISSYAGPCVEGPGTCLGSIGAGDYQDNVPFIGVLRSDDGKQLIVGFNELFYKENAANLKNSTIVMSDSPIPPSIREALALILKQIKAGNYKYQYTGGAYYCTFNLY